jgi:hypothetical protein
MADAHDAPPFPGRSSTTGGRELPMHLRESLADWVEGFITAPDPPGRPWPNVGQLKLLERELALSYPFNWSEKRGFRAVEDCLGRFHTDDDFALRVLDLLLRRVAVRADAETLRSILDGPGSRWEVKLARYDDDENHLTLRLAGPSSQALSLLAAGPAHDHLVDAWTAATEVEGDPSKAYREAVRAVEAAAKPVVTPNDRLATLGKIIGVLRDEPDGWVVTLRDDSVEDLIRRASVLWRSQHDRHGTDEPTQPMTREEAIEGCYLATALVGSFANGGIRPAR